MYENFNTQSEIDGHIGNTQHNIKAGRDFLNRIILSKNKGELSTSGERS